MEIISKEPGNDQSFDPYSLQLDARNHMRPSCVTKTLFFNIQLYFLIFNFLEIAILRYSRHNIKNNKFGLRSDT